MVFVVSNWGTIGESQFWKKNEKNNNNFASFSNSTFIFPLMYHLKTRVAFGLKFQVSFKDLHLEKAFSQIEPFLMAVFKYPYQLWEMLLVSNYRRRIAVWIGIEI